ncbi:16S rRNA (cytosine(967)-C(5))-methyltransferase RsmB [Lactobacillus sp. ESL0679]|uniref:16S rRNA (cytosine(967)-C(5))-methyltransferase RsmB n=1 Tax=Lactobacillus sp. ESL0679 TaxID=2983209 RepID=UPI0023F69B82|nr:16S rRNA (cytosine(967)-C(5))-methyltransferase RsmB [Lactobacillus sp. ESL0679]MDF7683169.1 16S rRNA (cytosine(967)-C(5))-methyltransferase RsmB [Lactobacillus sp. ESL0679]
MSTTKSARAVALQTLIRVLRDGSYSNISLNNSLRHSQLSQADRNFCTRLVYGTIQYKIYLEYQLHDLVKTKLKEDYLLPLLLMSSYQILFLDKVPNRAAVNEANLLAKQFGKPHSTGFKIVNGILHALIRRGSVLPDKKDVVQYLSVRESVPEWLVQYLINNWGFERTSSILTSINLPAKNTVRVARSVDTEEVIKALINLGFASEESALTSDELVLDRGGVSETPLFQDGKLTIQDEAASLAVNAFNFMGDEEVLDACSAPGGKTVQIAEQLATGHVTALDIHENKLRLVKQNAERMNVNERVVTKAMDARKADQVFAQGQFAKILVDAPCSGLGLLRRKPEIRYTKSLSDLTNLQKVQLALLDHLSGLVKANGELVYSTCTIAVEEDEAVVKTFLKQHPEFELQAFKAGKIDAPEGMLKILPDSYGSDGFFIAKFVRRG